MRASTLILIAATAASGVAMADDKEPRTEVLVVTAPMPEKLEPPVIDSSDAVPVQLQLSGRPIEPPTLEYESILIENTPTILASSDEVRTKT